MEGLRARLSSYGVGWVAAMVGLIVVIVIKIADIALTEDKILALFALAFLSLLLG